MTVSMAINGFGRIGRLALRALIESKRSDITISAINATSSTEMVAHLLKYDSVHGTCPFEVTYGDDWIDCGTGHIKVVSNREPEKLPWKELGIDIVLECTGKFTKKSEAERHIKAGAKRVLISAPGQDVDATIVYGVNHQKLTKEHIIVANASCTTNCLAPVAGLLQQHYGIKHGFMTTVHAYTGDQRILDGVHKDPRRARAAGMSMVPTSTGAAKAVGLVIPELKGKLDGVAVRVPTPNVSLVDLKVVLEKETTAEELNALFDKASKEDLKGILAVNTLPLVSIDFCHNPASSVVDATQTKVMGGTFARVASWYDNEWGFSHRMLDTASLMGKLMSA